MGDEKQQFLALILPSEFFLTRRLGSQTGWDGVISGI
jgi:hypothetical protein